MATVCYAKKSDNARRIVMERPTSLILNSPGLMNSKKGASRARRVPRTEDPRGKKVAHATPLEYTSRRRNTVDTETCTGLN